ncbi:MAG: hypothetical protein M3Z13_03985 [Candidatus Dormibacteraeota bacterium]|nr:hypothetical protein [Candidatus Dormibacteraeota bacterium]
MKTRFSGRRLLRYVWIPVVLTLVAAGTMTAMALNSSPDYKATATMVAKNPPSGLEKTLNFADIVTSNTVALRVKKQLNLSDSVDQLVGHIQVNSGRSNLYTITVQDLNPTRATAIANAVAREAGALYMALGSGTQSTVQADFDKQRAAYQQRHMDTAKALANFDNAHPGLVKAAEAGPVDPDLMAQRMQLQLNDQATAAAYLKFEDQATQARFTAVNSQRDYEAFMVDEAVAKPDQTRALLRIAYAAGIALLLGVAIVLFLQFRDRSVRDAEEVEQMLAMPVIATIPRATSRTSKAPRAS